MKTAEIQLRIILSIQMCHLRLKPEFLCNWFQLPSHIQFLFGSFQYFEVFSTSTFAPNAKCLISESKLLHCFPNLHVREAEQLSEERSFSVRNLDRNSLKKRKKYSP